ncbi:hypothetical protein AMS68_004657 [Peltaster fructicola]|uniref:Uncharacterized protein n=1 Tax=Peltaster fructicola TaxID=286661 RepID=A0A6H0XXJ0_9PEZI|nr:hypothetical protein AMS68_004657 [Peltaster fructicola]
MPARRYTADQLLRLRDSPLVAKPPNLPPIEQWIEYVYVDGNSREKLRIPHSEAQPQPQHDKAAGKISTRQPRVAVGGEASPMGNFSTGQRPSLMQTRTTGSRSDDIVLGPPKTAFASSRSITRLTSFNDALPPSEHTGQDEVDASRGVPFGDRQHQRKSTNYGEKDLRGERESWTATRERKALAEGDHNRTNSTAERRRDFDSRNGERQENRWAPKTDRRQNGDRQTGWRDQDVARRTDRWDRSDALERDPEWFDEPVTAQHDNPLEAGRTRTQADFEKWKAEMAANNKGANTPTTETAPALPKEVAKPKEALKLEGIVDKPFGGFGIKSPEPVEQGMPKPTAARGKASRFASMFKKDDSPVELPATPEAPAVPAMSGINLANNDDKEGFQRILQMLGKPASEPAATIEPKSPSKGANGARQRSRFFDATPKSPEGPQPPLPLQANNLPNERAHVRQDSDAQNQYAHSISPYPQHFEALQHRSNADESRHGDRPHDLPKGGTSTPENNIQNLLASQRAQRPAASTNKDTQFLLGLLQGHSARPPSQVSRQESDFPLWVSPQPEPHAPKPRAAPPSGHIDEHLLRHVAAGQGNPNDIDRRQPTRPPPGFDEQSILLQQQFQQRPPPQGFDPSQIRRSNGQLPNMPPHLHQQMPPQGPTELPFMPPGPPPGFGMHMHAPQGFPNMPGMFPNQNGPRQQVPAGFPPNMTPGSTGPPPGFGRAMPPPGPPGLMSPLPSGGPGQPNAIPGRGFDAMFDQRR